MATRSNVTPFPKTSSAPPRISLLVADLEHLEDPYDLYWPPPEKGKSESLTVRIDGDMRRGIDLLISQGIGPWRTPSDFLRSSIGTLFSVISQRLDTGKFKKFYQVLHIQTAAARAANKASQFHDALRTYEDTVDNLLKAGDVEGAREMCQTLHKELLEDDEVSDPRFKDGLERFFARRKIADLLD